MIKSMTAFANGEKNMNDVSVSIEVRSYNGKGLDIALRLPKGYTPLEERIRALISSKVSRGRVEIRIKISNEKLGAINYEIDQARASAFFDVLHELKEQFKIDAEISLQMLTGAEGIIKHGDTQPDMEPCWDVLKPCLEDTLDGLVAMREKEGEHIEHDLLERLDHIEKSLETIKNESEGLPELYQDRLKDRITALTNGLVELNTDRIAQEAAILADRSDISEEIVRVSSHIKQFRTITANPEPSGRKLNFLLQEFNREFTTIGSKAGNTGISHTVVDVKSELEKIREQVQNIE